MAKRSGILLPIASLPSPCGIGDFGPEAYRFVDFLHKTGQRVWAILPLLIPDALGSPFDSPSAFALNWMLVSPEKLVMDDLMRRETIGHKTKTNERINYGRVDIAKRRTIGLAWLHFQKHATPTMRKRFALFQKREREWLAPYTLFMAIKDRESGRPWTEWPSELRDGKPKVLREWETRHRKELQYFAFGQWLAYEQWAALKKYANAKGVRILGDLPYSVTHDSVDVWANRRFFHVGQYGTLRERSGAPPDLFYRKGQVWGNPLYNWSALSRDEFKWWIARFRKSLTLFDDVRLDHFRGFEAVWSIPAHAEAIRGHWARVPGQQFFRVVRKTFPHAHLIAEDLGKITENVDRLRDSFDLLGMRVLQFGFRHNLRHHHAPDVYPKNSVAYTGTHDMPTLAEWLSKATTDEQRILKAMGIERDTKGTTRLLAMALGSKSDTVILPIQDVLELGKTARLNRPGKVDRHNWTWRMEKNALNKTVSQKLKFLTKTSGRLKR